jgi:hypothetical protein
VPEKITQNTALFNRLLDGKLSPDEVRSLIQWLGDDHADPQAAEMILNQLKENS